MKKIISIVSFIFASAALCAADFINFPGWTKEWNIDDGSEVIETYMYYGSLGIADTMTITLEVSNVGDFYVYTSLNGYMHDSVGDGLPEAVFAMLAGFDGELQFGGMEKENIIYLDSVTMENSTQTFYFEVSWDDDFFHYVLYGDDRSELASFDLNRYDDMAFLPSITIGGENIACTVIDIAFTPIPEPAALAAAFGALALAFAAFRRKSCKR